MVRLPWAERISDASKRGIRRISYSSTGKKPHIAPVHKPDSALVYNANGNDVDTVLVDGEIVVRNKKSTRVDEAALIEECQARITFIKSRMAG